MKIEIEKSFELLTQAEWDEYLSTSLFDEMRIDIDVFSSYVDMIMLYPRLEESVKALFNKIGEMIITYALCKHYFDKGIPDDPWYISPGRKGESIEYFPNFQEEHYMRQYWFNYFSSSIYLRFFTYWDGILELVNIFYGIDEPVQDLRFRSNVLKALKQSQRNVHDFLTNIVKEPVYTEANGYRTNFVHKQAPSSITDEYTVKKNVESEIMRIIDGKPTPVKVRSAHVFSANIGSYVQVKSVMENTEAFARFSGAKIQELLKLMTSQVDTQCNKP